jgi:asparagine synthase (glutamine-hydrolysing)
MSGIGGIIHNSGQPVDLARLVAISERLAHRGPDGLGYYTGAGVGLMARCLAVAGRDHHQPATNATETIWAILDGTLYNAADLRRELTARGHRLVRGSDGELLAHLYEQMGDSFVERLVGEFACAVWDARCRRLLLVRDRLGVKPLYLAEAGGRLVFASELMAVLAYPDISRAVDLLGLSEYLTFQHTLAPRTIIKTVRKLPAGYMAIYEAGRLSLRQYWDLHFPPEEAKDRDQQAHVDRFRAAFETAIRRRLPEAGTVGAFLSGGMDSSSIVAMTCHLDRPDLLTFSAGVATNGTESELSRARLVADHFGTAHFELPFTSEAYIAALPRFIQHMDEPVADEASLLRLLLAEAARQSTTVILGGEGGDDVTGGYSFAIYQARFDRLRRFQRLPYWLREGLPLLASPLLPGRLRAWLARGNRDLATVNAEEHYAMVWAFEDAEKRRYCPLLHDCGTHCHDLARAIYADSGTTDPLSQALYFMTKVWAAENLMMSADRMTMAHGIEFRAPFLDHELVSVCAAIPSDYKVRRAAGGTYIIKAVLKEAMRDILPDAVMRLSKSPFQVPVSDWFQSVLRDCCEEVLLAERARSSGLYDLAQVRALLDRHCAAPGPASMVQIRNLLFFEMWRQSVLTPNGGD